MGSEAERLNRGNDMSYQAELVTVGKYSPKAETEELLTEMDEFDDDLADELEAQQDEEVPSFVSEEPQIVAQTPRRSYGLVDILLPMTPPKPKGARLVRGPLKFHQP